MNDFTVAFIKQIIEHEQEK